MNSLPVAKCEQCAFKQLRHPSDAHCYMFKHKPGNFCGQYKVAHGKGKGEHQ